MYADLVATYRVQLQAGFGFDAAASVVAYLAELGVSHLYCSPCLQAARGSTHGYDVVDPTRVNSELGGEAGFARLCAALNRAGMGLVIDIVPNHMAIRGRENAWWWDVLENGPASLYATHFDVDWDPPEVRFRNLIQLPILGDRYGKVVESRELKLVRDGGAFVLRYHDHVLPAAPRSLDGLLSAACDRANSDELAFLAGAFGRLPWPTQTDSLSVRRRHRDKAVLRDQLARLCRDRSEVADAIENVLIEWNRSPQLMDAFLQRQNYRISFWRNAERELGYRRFFDINTLIGLRVENEQVFEDTHDLVLRWVRDGAVNGLRVDHVDGLRDPAAYLGRLRDAAPQAWIVVEKILQPGELLPAGWPIAGTTGYDFLTLVSGLFVHPEGEQPLTRFYVDFTGESDDFPEVAHERKKQMLSTSLGADVNRLTALLLEISGNRPVSQDFTRHELHEALRAILAEFPVYRTYVVPDAPRPTPEDAGYIEQAVASSRQRRPDLDPELFSFLGDLLHARLKGELETEFVLRFQQLSAPVMAKGVEDTSFYCFNRFVALNEVGGAPDRFGTTIEQFHDACVLVQQHWPQTMLATSTHDTKRSEDVRARLALLSEIPDTWSAAVRRWSEQNERYKIGGFPDRNAEYLIYQTLVGAWPINSERMNAYIQKAAREAKQFTSWTNQNAEYEEAVSRFVEKILRDVEFLKDLEAFVKPLIPLGRVNALAQTLLKLTAPGVPDIYQGTELWDLSLVDPDNRRPVDYANRRSLLADVSDATPRVVNGMVDDGRLKLWLIRQTLAARRRYPDAFGRNGTYQRLHADGIKKNHVVAFARGEACVTIVSRWGLSSGNQWSDTSIELPAGRWRDEFTGTEHRGGKRPLGALLADFPVALLTTSSSPT